MALSVVLLSSLLAVFLWAGQSQQDPLVAANSEIHQQGVDDKILTVKRGWNDLGSSWGKRDWNKLQGVWGKRSDQDAEDDTAATAGDGDDEDLQKRNWNKLQGAWGKRTPDDNIDDDKASWEKRAWNQLQGAWGKRDASDMDKRGWNQLQGAWGKRSGLMEPRNEPDFQGLDELVKRASTWNTLRGVWGKRQPDNLGKGNEWSRKRETGWNNLKGLWG